MGSVADSMINGELCSWCGCYIDEGTTAYTLPDEEGETMGIFVGYDEEPIGHPVICEDCKLEET